MTIRVLLVDDHTMFREALRAMLAHAPGIEVVGEASDGAQVEALVDTLQPDAVVMDVSMPGLNGIDTTRRLHTRHPDVRVIALSAFVYKRFVLDMLHAGATAYVAKSAAGDELVRAIHHASQGKTYLCTEAATALADAVTRLSTRPGAWQCAHSPRLPNPSVHHVRMQPMRQGHSADTGPGLRARSHQLRLEFLGVFTPAPPALV